MGGYGDVRHDKLIQMEAGTAVRSVRSTTGRGAEGAVMYLRRAA